MPPAFPSSDAATPTTLHVDFLMINLSGSGASTRELFTAEVWQQLVKAVLGFPQLRRVDLWCGWEYYPEYDVRWPYLTNEVFKPLIDAGKLNCGWLSWPDGNRQHASVIPKSICAEKRADEKSTSS